MRHKWVAIRNHLCHSVPPTASARRRRQRRRRRLLNVRCSARQHGSCARYRAQAAVQMSGVKRVAELSRLRRSRKHQTVKERVFVSYCCGRAAARSFNRLFFRSPGLLAFAIVARAHAEKVHRLAGELTWHNREYLLALKPFNSRRWLKYAEGCNCGGPSRIHAPCMTTSFMRFISTHSRMREAGRLEEWKGERELLRL